MRISITEEKLLNDIPSGSGIVLHHDALFIVGDDAAYLYRIGFTSNKVERFILGKYNTTIHRIIKAEKADYEAATIGAINGKEYLFAFGSGSKIPQRDSLLMIALDDPAIQKICSLKSLYEYFRKETQTNPDQWNIEAAAVSDNKLILFNRGINKMIIIRWSEFVEYLNNQKLPAAESFNIELPSHNNHLARISGACTFGNNDILFCASIEDTKDWYNDGEVLGSYIGLIDMRTKKLKVILPVKTENGLLRKIKLESVDVMEENSKVIKAIAVADNDDGTTTLLRLTIAVD